MPDTVQAAPEVVPRPRTGPPAASRATQHASQRAAHHDTHHDTRHDTRHDARHEVPPGRPTAAPGGSLRIGSLLDGSCRTDDLLRVAAALCLPVAGRYVVVALAGGTPQDRAGVRARWRQEARTLWRATPELDHGIVLLDRDDRPPVISPATTPATTSATAPGVRTGIGLPVRGLAAITEARGRADLALTLCPAAGGSVRLGEHLTFALVRSDPQLAGELAAQVLGPLLCHDVPAAAAAGEAATGTDDGRDADVLLGTFAAWVAAGGSARDAATVLGCHRNTVTNRLRRLERLTGRRTDRPDDLVELVLAARACARGGGR